MSDGDKLPWLLATKPGAFAQAMDAARKSDNQANQAKTVSSANNQDRRTWFRLRSVEKIRSLLARRSWLAILLLLAIALGLEIGSD